MKIFRILMLVISMITFPRVVLHSQTQEEDLKNCQSNTIDDPWTERNFKSVAINEGKSVIISFKENPIDPRSLQNEEPSNWKINYNQCCSDALKTGKYRISNDIMLSMEWQMEERYGLDENENGIIDLPNSHDYVYNIKNYTYPPNTYRDQTCFHVQFKISLEWANLRFICPYKYVTKGIYNYIFDCTKFRKIAKNEYEFQLIDKIKVNLPDGSELIDDSGHTIIINDTANILIYDTSNIFQPIIKKTEIVKNSQQAADETKTNRQAKRTNKNYRKSNQNNYRYPAIDYCISYRDKFLRSKIEIIDMETNEIAFSDSPLKANYNLSLPEKEFLVKIAAYDDHNMTKREIEKKIVIKDILIVAMGDSYSAGQGTPEYSMQESKFDIGNELLNSLNNNVSLILFTNYNGWTPNFSYDQEVIGEYIKSKYGCNYNRNCTGYPYHKIIWADDGVTPFIKMTKIDLPVTYRASGFISKQMNNNTETKSVDIPVFSYWPHTFTKPVYQPVPGEETDMYKQHQLANRSSYCGSSQYAYWLEKSDPHTSVTYVNLAMSGSRIGLGLVLPDKYFGDNSSNYYEKELLPSQINQLNTILENRDNNQRTINYLILSIGGNDVGFSNIIESLIVRNDMDIDNTAEGPDLQYLNNAFHDGNWGQVIQNLNSDMFGVYNADSKYIDALSYNDALGLDNLRSNFISLKEDHLRKFDIDHILLLEYPTLIEASENKDPNKKCYQVFCGIIEYIDYPGIFYETKGLEIDKKEINWLASNIMKPLNDTLENIASSLGWTFVDGIYENSKKHGLCGESIYPERDYPDVEKINKEWASKITFLEYPVCEGNEKLIYTQIDHNSLLNINPYSKSRWYRELGEGAWIQQTGLKETSLAAHPNEYGYKSIALEIKRVIDILNNE